MNTDHQRKEPKDVYEHHKDIKGSYYRNNSILKGKIVNHMAMFNPVGI